MKQINETMLRNWLNGTKQEILIFSLRHFWPLVPKFSFWKGDWTLGSPSTHFWIFFYNFKVWSCLALRVTICEWFFLCYIPCTTLVMNRTYTKILKSFIILCPRLSELFFFLFFDHWKGDWDWVLGSTFTYF